MCSNNICSTQFKQPIFIHELPRHRACLQNKHVPAAEGKNKTWNPNAKGENGRQRQEQGPCVPPTVPRTPFLCSEKCAVTTSFSGDKTKTGGNNVKGVDQCMCSNLSGDSVVAPLSKLFDSVSHVHHARSFHLVGGGGRKTEKGEGAIGKSRIVVVAAVCGRYCP